MTDTANNAGALQKRIKRHVRAKEHSFFAVVQPGFEKTARNELEQAGIKDFSESVPGGLQFRSKLDGCYRVNLCSRTISRLIMRLSSFKAERFDIFRKKIENFPWELHLKAGTNIKFSIKCRKSKLYHTGRLAEELEKGIRAKLYGYGINVDFNPNAPEDNSQRIFLLCEHNRCTLSLDTSGELLYKRGYKKYISTAPIRETTASLILMESQFQKYDLLIDPMCGTGTFSLEAAGMISGMPPGINRNFAFMQWPVFSKPAFEFMKKNLTPAEKPSGIKLKFILASDLSRKNIDALYKNIGLSGLSEYVKVSRNNFFDKPESDFKNKKILLVINPPYGKRIKEDLKGIYRNIGKTIRKYYAGSGYAIITPGIEYEKIMSLPYDKKIPFINGGIKVAVIIKF